jgi:FkbM family methyltransferase
MLIEMDLNYLKRKYNLNLKGTINVGSYLASEYDLYKKLNINNIIFIEANPNIIEKLKIRVGSECIVFNYLIYDKDDVELDFNICHHLQSSSLLDFKQHKMYYPELSNVIDIIKLKTKKLDTLIKENNIDMNKFNTLMLDVQGAEKLVLDGFTENIKYIDYIYTEVNFDEMYKDCVLFDTLNECLNAHGFKLIEYFDTKKGWGDALYGRI